MQSQGQVYADPDILQVLNDSQKNKAEKKKKIFGGNNQKNPTGKTPSPSAKGSSTPVTPSTIITSPSKASGLTNDSGYQDSKTSLINDADAPGTPSSASSSTTHHARKNHRAGAADPNAAGSSKASSGNLKSDRRKDVKLTNCQEKDGIWTATGQFGRESRHSKRADITYDKKKFRFIQKDDQGNKHVFEIPAAEVEGKPDLSPRRKDVTFHVFQTVHETLIPFRFV